MSTKLAEKAIRKGIAADGTPGDVLLKNIGADNFWPIDAFGITNLHGPGCRFKVKGKRFVGTVAIQTMSGGNFDVSFGKIAKKKFVPTNEYLAVAPEQLTPLLSAAVDDELAEAIKV